MSSKRNTPEQDDMTVAKLRGVEVGQWVTIMHDGSETEAEVTTVREFDTFTMVQVAVDDGPAGDRFGLVTVCVDHVTCPTCQGQGEVPVPGTYGVTISPEALVLTTCPDCHGRTVR